MKKTLAIALLAVALGGCGMGIGPRLMTGDGPDIIGQVHQQADGLLVLYDQAVNRCREVEVSSRLMRTLAKDALVGATVAIWMNGDDLADRINIRGRDRFHPNLCVGQSTPLDTSPAIYRPAILTTRVTP